MFGFDPYFNQLNRIERKLDTILKIVTRTEQEVLVAYEAELDAAEAAAKANSEVDDSVEQILVAVTELIANLKNAGTDPATAARIASLASAVKARAERLAAAAATVPTS